VRDAAVKDFVSVVLAVDQRLVSGGDVDVRHGRENQSLREKQRCRVCVFFLVFGDTICEQTLVMGNAIYKLFLFVLRGVVL